MSELDNYWLRNAKRNVLSRRRLLGSAAVTGVGTASLALVGCGQTTTTFVKSDTTLGRVVIYRSGVAYFERYADVPLGAEQPLWWWEPAPRAT